MKNQAWRPQSVPPLARRAGRWYNGQTRKGDRKMETTAQDVFAEAVSYLSMSERLRLASLILQDLTESGLTVVDRRDDWDDQDQCELASLSLGYAARLYPED